MAAGWKRCALVLGLAVSVLAVDVRVASADLPRTVWVQGRVDTFGGTPATGPLDLTLKLFATETSTGALWSQQYTGVDLYGGVFDVALGPVTAGVFEAADSLWLETTVGADALPRQSLRAVPYALVAQEARVALVAKDLQCSGCVGAADLAPSLVLSGNVSVAGGLTPCSAGAPGCSLALPGGGALKSGGSGWVHVLVPDGLRIRNAADDAWRPLSFGGGTAYGDLAITGSATIGTNLIVCNAGSCSPSFPGGAGHAFVEGSLLVGAGFGVDATGALTATTLSAQRAALSASVRVGPDSAACTGSFAGAIRFAGGQFEGCDGAAWRPIRVQAPPTISGVSPSSGGGGATVTVAGAGFVAGAIVHIGGRWADVTSTSATSIAAVVPEGGANGVKAVRVQNPDGQSASLADSFTLTGLGSSPANALQSCLDIKEQDPGATDGLYYVDPDGGSTSNAFATWCDMTTDGGGWTLVRVANGTTSPSLVTEDAVNVAGLTSPTANVNAQLSSATTNLLGTIMMADNTAASGDSKIWYDRLRACNAALRTFRWTFSSSLPVVTACPGASSVYPPSQDKWGQDVGGGTHINYNAQHPLCFGAWINPSKGHVCFNRNSWDWWNYGSSAPAIANGNAVTATFVRRDKSPSASCKAIKNANPSAENGIYLLDPDGGSNNNAFHTHCDMTTDGGGWTLVRVTDGSTTNDLRTEAEVNAAALATGPAATGNGQLASTMVNQLGTVLMTRNVAAGYDSTLWYDRMRACNSALTTLFWTFQPSLPVVTACPSASSTYPPSQNLWGQGVGGGTHINYNAQHPLCFGSWNPGTKGHVCFNRNSWDWWNYGTDGNTSNNAAARTATWIR